MQPWHKSSVQPFISRWFLRQSLIFEQFLYLQQRYIRREIIRSHSREYRGLREGLSEDLGMAWQDQFDQKDLADALGQLGTNALHVPKVRYLTLCY